MDAICKKELLRVFPVLLRELIPGLEPYPASRQEAITFMAGSRFYRRALSPGVYVYLVLCPGEGRECCFSVDLGWAFGETIAPFNYSDQLRELSPNVGPSPLFQAGFFGLHELEQQPAFWGEEISVDSEGIEAAVRHAAYGVLSRVRIQLPHFEERLREAAKSWLALASA